MGQANGHLIVQTFLGSMCNVEMVHHPGLRAVVKFAAAGQAIAQTNVPIVTRIIRSAGIVESILKIPAIRRLKADFLHQVDLLIPRRTLYEWIIIGHYNVGVVLSLDIKRAQIRFWPKTPHLQIVKIKTGKTAHQSPFFPTHIEVKMGCFFIIGR